MSPSSTTLTASLVVLAVVLWYGTAQFTENTTVQLAVLIGVGVVLPIAVSEWRTRPESRS